MDQLSSVFAQFNAADLLWIAGAVVLVILAVKVAAKLLRFLLVAVAVVAAVAFLVSAGIIPAFF